jgi:hypothetical protein
MYSSSSDALLLKDIVELDETIVGGKACQIAEGATQTRQRHQKTVGAYFRTEPWPGRGSSYLI